MPIQTASCSRAALLGALTAVATRTRSNYAFCSEWARIFAPKPNASVLDYGCGAGQIVQLMRATGLDAYGCDVFYAGGDYSAGLSASVRPYVRRMTSDRIPFDDGFFDLVTSNQVIEHVENLDVVLGEIHRVLRPGGAALNLFGHLGCWREGHSGIPFLHRFRKGSSARVYYATALRAMGLGYHKTGKGMRQWSEDFCKWLDDWTWYRSTGDVRATFARHFHCSELIDKAWLSYRLGPLGRPFAALPNAFSAAIARPMAGLVVLSFK